MNAEEGLQGGGGEPSDIEVFRVHTKQLIVCVEEAKELVERANYHLAVVRILADRIDDALERQK